MRWIELSVEVHPEAVDAVAAVFQDQGTGGVAIEQPVSSHIEGEEPPRFLGNPVIKAYLPENAEAPNREREIERALWHLQAFDLSPIGPMQRRVIDEEDWAHGWKEHFHPLRIGRVVIKPSWREWDAQPEDLVIELDPGMAFGTGLHPTTKLMVDAVQQRVKPGMRVLDLGTGSGILAMAAALLGAHVVGLDISDVAVEVARANVAANGMQAAIEIDEGSIDAIAGQTFDLILANIIASVLIDLAPQLAGALKPGAEALASGIIEERLAPVVDAFQRAGLQVVSRNHEEDWWLVVARRS
ncbi:MAG TPA: 50S ribosomal protein L11 methyltransferase [Chloroflexota bacterium]|nr:50S ribosomal protein L11 methyltransferase [Chloroflexota bacterium]